jgi:hypothetical protein
MIVIYVLFSAYMVFVVGRPMMDFLSAMYTFCAFSVLWPISRYRWPRLSKYIICFWFLCVATVNVYSAFNHEKDPFVKRLLPYNEKFMQLSVFYLMCVAIFAYCEYKLCLFIYTPIYIVATYLLSVAERDYILTV